MRHFIHAAAVCCALALLAVSSATAEPKDWDSGKNTWKNAHKGDWAEYAMQLGNKVRYEVTDVVEDKVHYKHVMYDKDGKETSNKQRNKAWSDCPLFGKLPYRIDVAWTVAEFKIGEQTLSCDVASWTSGTTAMAVWYCTKVPCGGIVKQAIDGADTVWLTGFKSKELGEAKTGDKPGDKPVEPTAASKLPRFFQAVGNYYIHKITRAGSDSYVKRTVSEVTVEATQMTMVTCDAEGVPAPGARVSEVTQTEAAWLKDYAKAEKTGEMVKVAAGEFKCDLFKTVSGNREVQEWVSDGIPVKKIVKDGEKETAIELAKYEMK